MQVRTRLDPIDRDIAVLIDRDLSPAAQSAALARFARENLDEAREQNRRVVGREVPHDSFVDGVESDAFERVRPDGRIVSEFRLLDDALLWISEQLVRHAPFRSGRFAASFILLADGAQVDIAAAAPLAEEYVFLNAQPYARKIERGQSPQAPDGVFEAVAAIAQGRFGNSSRITFGFRSAILPYVAGARNRAERAALRQQPARRSAMAMERATRTPAITVRPR